MSGFKEEFQLPTLWTDASDATTRLRALFATGYINPDEANDLLHFIDAKGKALVEFSAVEDGIYEAPTPGVGVLFLQAAAAAGPPPTPPEQLAGDWKIVRTDGAAICHLTLTSNPSQDALAMRVKPGCDAAIARLNLTLWRIDRDELMLVPARGTPLRFEAVDAKTWRRVPESANSMTLVRE